MSSARMGRPPKEYDPATIGGFIKKTRIEQGLSLDELADKAGIGRSYLQKIEANQSEPTFVLVVTLARTLNISLDELARRAPEKSRLQKIRRRVALELRRKRKRGKRKA